VAVPVLLRGEVIGAIEVEPGEDTDETVSVDMVRAIAQRLATSLENARLYEEAQAATAQEQRINRIVSRFQTAATVDDLLQITLTELSETLGARRGAIRLGVVPDTAQPNGGQPS
jgi:GAF domain-containing protein